MAGTLLKNAGKIVIGAGAVYVTVDQGVWSNSHHGTEALDKFKQYVLPPSSDYVDEIPSMSDVNIGILDTWNSGVRVTFSFLAEAPNRTCIYLKKAFRDVLYQGSLGYK